MKLCSSDKHYITVTVLFKLLINGSLTDEDEICELDQLSYLLSPMEIFGALHRLIYGLVSSQDIFETMLSWLNYY